MNNLISELHSIEKEADQLIEDARRQAEQTISSIPDQIASLTKDLDSARQAKCDERKAEVAAKTKAELATIDAEFETQKQRLERIPDADIASFADRIVQRLQG